MMALCCCRFLSGPWSCGCLESTVVPACRQVWAAVSCLLCWCCAAAASLQSSCLPAPASFAVPPLDGSCHVPALTQGQCLLPLSSADVPKVCAVAQAYPSLSSIALASRTHSVPSAAMHAAQECGCTQLLPPSCHLADATMSLIGCTASAQTPGSVVPSSLSCYQGLLHPCWLQKAAQHTSPAGSLSLAESPFDPSTKCFVTMSWACAPLPM